VAATGHRPSQGAAVRRNLTRTLVLLLLATGLAGCGALGGVDPSGKVTSRRVPATGATRLEVESAFNVKVTTGADTAAAVISYDDNLADRLDVGVDGATLRIGLKDGKSIGPGATLRAEVTLGRLEAVSASGSSNVGVTGTLVGATLRTEMSGSSHLTGVVELEGLQATVSGASELELTGSASTANLDASGASRLALDGLQVREADVRLSGGSRAEVDATATIAAEASGGSRLTYRGSPRFTRREASGGASIEAA
jgi:hypothetical protein